MVEGTEKRKDRASKVAALLRVSSCAANPAFQQAENSTRREQAAC